ncbi:MAG: YicC family protein [Candidatus Omnitrophica bacterium]|nr:YicC family protein [Candidatus Omnitrophota bacterium]
MGMITGMTGFGSAQFSVGKVKGSVEVKSVNHRYLDIAFYLPTGFGMAENKIREMLAKTLARGRVTVSVRITDKPSQEVSFNEEMIDEYLHHAKSIEKKYKLSNNLTLADLIRMPGVVDVKEVFVEAADMWPSVEKAMVLSLKSLKVMRQREGKSLAADISDKLKKMTARLKGIEKRSQEILKARQKTLKPEEFSSFQKSIDVNEEIARFNHYIEEMAALLKSDVPVGKKLDFIAQEMQRETNTLGSKLQDDLVSNSVIALKSKIEKIREQANNVE